MYWFTLVFDAGAATCETASTAAQLAAYVEQAEAAFAALDDTTFTTSLDATTLALPCLAEPLTSAIASRYHRMLGLDAWTVADVDSVRLAFAAARELDPTYQLPTSLAPQGGPLQALYAAALPEPSFTRVPDPRDGYLAFDGVVSRERPGHRTSVVQLVDDQGRILSTTLVRPGGPLPTYAVIPRRRHAALATSAVAGVASATLLGLAAWNNASFDAFEPDPGASPAENTDRLGAYRSRSAALIGGAIATGTVTAGGLGVAVVVGRR